MNTQDLVTILAAVTTVGNAVLMWYISTKKLRPEVKKLEAEEDSEISNAAHINLEGAKISSTMLIDRIEELKLDLTAEKKARRDDAEYFRRRIKDIEKEARDYRLWAARLAKQVIEVGKVPVPFISSLNDSDPLITAITREQEQLAKAKDSRQAELEDQQEKENKDDQNLRT